MIKRLRSEAKLRGLEFEIIELKKHTGIRIGSVTRTLGRHTEIPEKTFVRFYQQFSDELGKGWWK